MKKEETYNLAEEYVKAIMRRVDAAQSTGDIPEDFVFQFGDKTFVMTLPHSVMAQKRLLNLRAKHLSSPDDFEAEEAFIKAIAANTKIGNTPVNIELLSVGEIEVIKIAYMDGLLLPLSQGGDKAVQTFMELAAKNIH